MIIWFTILPTKNDPGKVGGYGPPNWAISCGWLWSCTPPGFKPTYCTKKKKSLSLCSLACDRCVAGPGNGALCQLWQRCMLVQVQLGPIYGHEPMLIFSTGVIRSLLNAMPWGLLSYLPRTSDSSFLEATLTTLHKTTHLTLDCKLRIISKEYAPTDNRSLKLSIQRSLC